MKFVFCAYGGQKYADQLAQSVRSVLVWHPEARIIVYTRPEFQPFLEDLPVQERLLDGKAPKPGTWHDPFMKVRAVCDAAAEGEAFAYLDNDTFVAGDISGAWDLLQHYDCLGVQSSIHDQRGFLGLEPAPGLQRPSPDVFPEWNGGVLFFAGTPAAQRIAARWLEVLEMQISGGGDQWPLAQALWDSRARLHVLPLTYNCRLPATPVVYGPIRILHADHTDLSGIAKALNADTGLRRVVADADGFALAPAGSTGQRMF